MTDQPNVRAEVRHDFVILGSLFRNHFAKPERVYYPGCGYDATPAIAFYGSAVTFLDIAADGLKAIRQLLPNATTVLAPAESFAPEMPFDLVIDSHSHAPFEAEVKDLKSGGHLIIATKGSDKAFNSDKFTLVGAVHIVRGGGIYTQSLVTENLVKYKEIDPEHHQFSFSNSRRLKATQYIFRKR